MAKKDRSRGGRVEMIAFRPGPVLAGWIAEQAAAWHLSAHEVARRLVTLACCDLTLENYPELVKYAATKADQVGGEPDFTGACAEVRAMLTGVNRERQDSNKEPLTSEDRTTFVRRLLEEAIAARPSSRPTA